MRIPADTPPAPPLLRRRRARLCLMLVGLAACVIAGWRDAAAQPVVVPPPERSEITIAVPATIAVQQNVYLAKELGYFQEQGLTVEIKPAGSQIIPLVVSGQVYAAQFGAASALVPVLRGKETLIVYKNSGAGSGGIVVGLPNIKSFEQCTKVATLGKGSAGYGNIAHYRKLLGARFDHTTVTDVQTKRAALLSGSVDCIGGVYDEFALLIAGGRVNLLIDTRDLQQRVRWLGSDYVEGVLFGLKDTFQATPGTLTRLLIAKDRAQQWANQRSSEEIVQLLKRNADFQTVPLDALMDQQAVARTYIAKDGALSQSDWKTALERFAEWDTGLDFANPLYSYEQRIDMRAFELARAWNRAHPLPAR